VSAQGGVAVVLTWASSVVSRARQAGLFFSRTRAGVVWFPQRNENEPYCKQTSPDHTDHWTRDFAWLTFGLGAY